MAAIKITQLIEKDSTTNSDDVPFARGSDGETYKIKLNKFVRSGKNLGSGSAQFYVGTGLSPSGDTTELQFRSLSGDTGVSIQNIANTIVISTSGQNPIKNKFIGDGVINIFNLSGVNTFDPNNYRVDINGILQEPTQDYIINNSSLVFTIAPPLSSKIVVVSNNLISRFEVIPGIKTVTNTSFAESVGMNTWISIIGNNYTALVGDRISANTSSGPFSITLPLNPTPFSEVTFADHYNKWATNNLTIARNGSLIDGLAENLICNISGRQITLRYESASIGWKIYI